MIVFPESMNRLDKDNVPASLATVEDFIRYMCERVDFSTRNGTNNLDTVAATLAATVSRISTVEQTISDLDAALDGKVDKEEGKGLSSNDYTDADKAELADHETRITALEDVLSTSGPILYQNAQDITAEVGETAVFSVKVLYSSTVAYAWEMKYGSNWITPGFPGINTDSLSVPVTAGRDGYQFHCIITAGGFSITSRLATLHVS